jgi:branched-chain amino acid aminotransferase
MNKSEETVFFLTSEGAKAQSHLLVSDFPDSISVFESFRTYQGVIFLFDEHLGRLEKSAKTIGLALPFSKKEYKNFMTESFKKTKLKEAFLRLTVSKHQSFLFVTPLKKKSKELKTGVAIQFTTVRRNTSNSFAPEAKTSTYLNAILARLDSQEAHELVYLNTFGYVAEGLISNLFLVKNGVLKTTPCVGILDGLTRSFVIKLARSLKLKIEETWLTRHDFYNADEVFLTYSSAEVVPVRQIDGRCVGLKTPGPVVNRLKKAYQQHVQNYVSCHRH